MMFTVAAYMAFGALACIFGLFVLGILASRATCKSSTVRELEKRISYIDAELARLGRSQQIHEKQYHLVKYAGARVSGDNGDKGEASGS